MTTAHETAARVVNAVLALSVHLTSANPFQDAEDAIGTLSELVLLASVTADALHYGTEALDAFGQRAGGNASAERAADATRRPTT